MGGLEALIEPGTAFLPILRCDLDALPARPVRVVACTEARLEVDGAVLRPAVPDLSLCHKLAGGMRRTTLYGQGAFVAESPEDAAAWLRRLAAEDPQGALQVLERGVRVHTAARPTYRPIHVGRHQRGLAQLLLKRLPPAGRRRALALLGRCIAAQT